MRPPASPACLSGIRRRRCAAEPVGRPGQIGYLGDKLWLNPVHARETSGDPKRVLRGGGTLRGDVLRASGSRRRRRSARTLTGMPVPTRPISCRLEGQGGPEDLVGDPEPPRASRSAGNRVRLDRFLEDAKQSTYAAGPIKSVIIRPRPRFGMNLVPRTHRARGSRRLTSPISSAQYRAASLSAVIREQCRAGRVGLYSALFLPPSPAR